MAFSPSEYEGEDYAGKPPRRQTLAQSAGKGLSLRNARITPGTSTARARRIHGPRRTRQIQDDRARPRRCSPDFAGRVLDAVHAEPRLQARPKMVVRAEGMYFWNDRGDKIIDASSGLFCVAAGHCRKEIADAVSRQLRELDFSAPFLRGHPKQFELATRVAELTPGDLNRIFFVNSGSEAIDTAMKVALAYHQARGQGGRNMFVSRERAYHGVNFGGVSLSGLVNNRRRFGPTLAGHRAHAAHALAGEPVHAWRRRARRGPGGRPAAFRQSVRRGEHRRLLRRADRRLHRRARAAQGLSQAAARNLRPARHPAGVRRGDHRLRAHRRRLSRRRASASRPTS